MAKGYDDAHADLVVLSGGTAAIIGCGVELPDVESLIVGHGDHHAAEARRYAKGSGGDHTAAGLLTLFASGAAGGASA